MTPGFSLDYRFHNILRVDQQFLQADLYFTEDAEGFTPTTPEQLTQIVKMGGKALEQKGMVWLARLATEEQTDGPDSLVYTTEGYANNTGIHENITEIQEVFHPYWNAVLEAGYAVHTRNATDTSGGTSKSSERMSLGGAWLLLSSRQ